MSSPAGGERHPLAPLFDPRSIAVVGASADPAKRGYQILRALGEAGYRGRVFPVNPKGGSLLGHRVLPSIRSLPEPADLAVLCTPGATAPELISACGERGVGAAIVLGVGFGESGAEGMGLERRLVDAARASGVRVLGPNTSGLLNLHTGANLIGARDVRPGCLALLVQSGNMALSLMTQATRATWEGISICVGVGNESDVGFPEALDYLGTHEDTRAVIVYAEGLKKPRAFLQVAARVTRAKPVVMIKGARSARGASSALSHTGAIAGPYDRLRAGLAQAGVVEVRRTDELLHTAHALANQPVMVTGSGVAILSDGGGQATLAVDTLTELGTPLAELTGATRSGLRGLLGPAAAVGNPVDLAGAADSDPLVFARALELLGEDPQVGVAMLVGLFGGYGIRFTEGHTALETKAAHALTERMRQANKGLVVHSMYASHRSAPLEALGRAGVPVIESLDVACRCVADLCRHGARRSRPTWTAELSESGGPPPSVVTTAYGEGRSILTEPEARRLLAQYGVIFGEAIEVGTEDQAAAALESVGGLAALKIVSKQIVHKSEAGCVVVDIDSESAARKAFGHVARAAEEYALRLGLPDEPPVALLAPMAPPPLVELLVGACREPGLGPVLTIGSGGMWVELLDDVAHRVLPVERDDVAAMLEELRIKRLLDGYRAAPPAHVDGVVSAARAIADCIERVEAVKEIEINPLFVYADRVEPIDARVVLVEPARKRPAVGRS